MSRGNAAAYVVMLVAAIVLSFVLGGLAAYQGVSYYAWLFVLPSIPVGLVAALVGYHLMRWPAELPQRRVGFVFVSALVTMLVSGVAVQVFLHAGKSPKPEFVYIRGEDTIELSVPETVRVDEMIPVTVRRKDVWKRVRLEDLPRDVGSYGESLPPSTSSPPAGRVEMRTDPWGAAVVYTSNSDTGEMKVHVRSAQPFTMWIEVGVRKVPLKSNVATVTPRAKN